MARITPILAAVGLCLVALSGAWQVLFPPDWSQEQAENFAQSAAELHDATHARGETPGQVKGHGHEHAAASETPEAREQRYQTAKQSYEQSAARLQAAQTRGETAARFFFWTGILCTLGSGVGYYVLRVPHANPGR
jgi:hypothetical protein